MSPLRKLRQCFSSCALLRSPGLTSPRWDVLCQTEIRCSLVGGLGLLSGVISEAAFSAGAPFLLTASIFGVTWGATYIDARTVFRRFIKRRVRIR